MRNSTVDLHMNSPAPAAMSAMGRQMRAEFPWLDGSVIQCLEHVANGKVVVPDLELDRHIHAVCLLSPVYNRLNSIMYQHAGLCFEHRPACKIGGGIDTRISCPPLARADLDECRALYEPLIEQMRRLEGRDSVVNMRATEPGVYSKEEYELVRGKAVILN